MDQYYNEILADLLANINSHQYRVRQSCCLALQDFLKGYGNRTIHDAVDVMDELWTKVFRVMDDHHEQTRITANKTARVLSKVSKIIFIALLVSALVYFRQFSK